MAALPSFAAVPALEGPVSIPSRAPSLCAVAAAPALRAVVPLSPRYHCAILIPRALCRWKGGLLSRAPNVLSMHAMLFSLVTGVIGACLHIAACSSLGALSHD